MLVETASTNVGTVTGAIRKAAQVTGTGFDYLLATARIESNLNPAIKAPTSSATGLFQFVDQTWLETMKQSGSRLGYGNYSDVISRAANGRYYVSDPKLRSEIMALRKDPTANALMAGAFTQRNAARLEDRLKRAPTDGELYMAHFLGAGGAARLILAAQSNPQRKAADFLPGAAAANRSIFYTRQGRALSVAQVYGKLAAKLGAARAAAASQIAQAALPVPMPLASPRAATPAPSAAGNVALSLPVNAAMRLSSPLRGKVETAPISSVAVPAAGARMAFAAEGSARSRPATPVFHTFFRTDTRGAVSPVVASLWGNGPASAESPAAIADRERRQRQAPGNAASADVFGLLQAQRAWSRRG